MLFLGYCSGLYPIITLVKRIISLLQIGVPIALILFGMIDLGKAVIAGKEDEMKKAQSTLIKRVIYAVVFFLIITIINLVMNLVAGTGASGLGSEPLDVNSWRACWNCNSLDECKRIDTLNGYGGSSYFSDTNETDESRGIKCYYENWNKKYTCVVEDSND